MAKDNCAMVKLFLFASLLLAVTANSTKSRPTQFDRISSIVGSLRIYPTFIHKCSAFYLHKNVMATTANCVEGFEPSSMHVQVRSKHLGADDASEILPVRKIFIHPNYTRQTEQFNIALIEVEKSRYQRRIIRLETQNVKGGDQISSIFSWQFDNDIQDFSLTSIKAHLLSSKACLQIMDVKVPPNYYCFGTDKSYTLGPYDEGAPVIAETGKAIGILTNYVEMEESKVFLYYSIQTPRKWIDQVLASEHPEYRTFSLPLTKVIAAVSALAKAISEAFFKITRRS